MTVLLLGQEWEENLWEKILVRGEAKKHLNTHFRREGVFCDEILTGEKLDLQSRFGGGHISRFVVLLGLAGCYRLRPSVVDRSTGDDVAIDVLRLKGFFDPA